MKPRTGFNREHLWETGSRWEKLTLPRILRGHPAQIGHIAIYRHEQMNRELQPDFAVMSDNLTREVLGWLDDTGAARVSPEDRWRVLEQEESHLRNFSHWKRGLPIGREAVYFADCIAMKLPYWRPLG